MRGHTNGSAPLLALGMVVSPNNEAKRKIVRHTMLQADSVRSGLAAFRFVIGCGPGAGCERGHSRVAPAADVLAVAALDGAEVSEHGPHCACVEKTVEWFKFALGRWPRASFYGKTEDDTYVHVDGLVYELTRLLQRRTSNLVLGKMSVCAMPDAPRATMRRPPHRGVDYRNHGDAATPVGYQGCFLGDPENWAPPRDGREAVKAWSRQLARCGEASTPAPFPTGPLVVFGADVAATLFLRCSHLRGFVQRGRQANRRTRCSWVGARDDSLPHALDLGLAQVELEPVDGGSEELVEREDPSLRELREDLLERQAVQELVVPQLLQLHPLEANGCLDLWPAYRAAARGGGSAAAPSSNGRAQVHLRKLVARRRCTRDLPHSHPVPLLRLRATSIVSAGTGRLLLLLLLTAPCRVPSRLWS